MLPQNDKPVLASVGCTFFEFVDIPAALITEMSKQLKVQPLSFSLSLVVRTYNP